MVAAARSFQSLPLRADPRSAGRVVAGMESDEVSQEAANTAGQSATIPARMNARKPAVVACGCGWAVAVFP